VPDRSFDDVTRVIAARTSRRTVGRVAGTGLVVTAISRALQPSGTDAKKTRVQGEHNIRGNKAIMCYQGETIRVPSDKRKKWLKRGATRGKCSLVPPDCVPSCQTGTCGGSDGCGGTCGCLAGEICDNGTCHTCTVECTGTPDECGVALNEALAAPGTIYLCPGVYQGNFTVGNHTIVGAGSGEGAASNSILDGNDEGTVVTVAVEATATLRALRITGGLKPKEVGGGILVQNGATLEVDTCSIVENEAASAGGIAVQVSSLTLRNSLVARNTAEDGGGVACNNADTCSFIDSLITANTATVTVGGGVTGYTTAMNFANTELSENTAAQNGGGVLIGNGTASATFDAASRVVDNKANTSGVGFSGGGIFNGYGGTLNLNGATLSGNTPDQCSGPGCPV
jgi:hypothetical protein